MKICLGLEYDGAHFSGWQSQVEARTIQGCLEAALSRVAAHPVKVQGAGRTDAGVHATRQVVHFETAVARPSRAWVLGTNSNLPADIGVLWATPIAAQFDARFSATARRYRYVISNRMTRAGLWHGKLSWECRSLAVEPMAAAASYLLGEHDFSSFRAAGCQSNHAIRTIHRLTVQRVGDLVLVDVEANAFLQHMVRNIVGVLLEIGRGERPSAWAREVLLARNRTLAGMTAPAAGLYLTGVRYPPEFALDTWPLELPFDSAPSPPARNAD